MKKTDNSGLNFLLHLCLRYPRTLVITVLLAIAAGLITAPAPYLAKIIIDDLIFRGLRPGAVDAAVSGWLGLSQTVWMIFFLVLLGVALKFFGAIVVGWQNYFILLITRNGLFETRLQMALRLIGAPQRFFESAEPGRLASRLTMDVNQIDGSVYTVLRQMVSSVFLIAVVIFFMLAMNVWLTGVILITLPITALVTFYVYRWMREYNREESDRIAALTATSAEVFGAIKVIRTFNAEPYFLNRIKARSEDLRFQGLLHWTVFHTVNSLINTFSNFGADLFLLVGGYLALQGQITFGEFFAFSSYQAMLWGPVNVLLNSGTVLQTGIASAEKVTELLEVEQEPYLEKTNNKQVEAFRGEIRAEKLGFSYHEDEPILQDLSFHLPPGSMTALVGQSGSGKTTLASLLMGLYLPKSGKLLVDGIDLREWDLKALRSHIGIVLQDAVLFNDTIRANLSLGREGLDDERIWSALKLAHLDETIMRLPDRLDTRVGVNGARLSGGQKQRIAIARVFLKNPKLLILDEATSALDSETEKAIQRSFDALMAGRTAVVIAHRLSTIYQADQIMVLHQGRLMEMGTHEELSQKPGGAYRELYEAQVEGMIPMSGATRRPWSAART